MGYIIISDRDSAADAGPERDAGTVEQRFDWSETPPSSAVVETVAAVTDTEPTELDAIQYSIDADALDTLLEDAATPAEFHISFEYAGVAVTVTGTGLLRVELDY